MPYLHRLSRTRLLQDKCRTRLIPDKCRVRLNATVRPQTMKRPLFILAILAATLAESADTLPATGGWSETVSGLQARLLLGKRHTPSGSDIPEVYLELHNVSDRGLLLVFDYVAQTSVRFELKSADGKPVPRPLGGAGGNRCHDKMQVQLPMDGTLRFPVSCHSALPSTKGSTVLQLDPEEAIWEIPATNSQAYFLSGTLEVAQPAPEVNTATWPNWRWHGTIKIPSISVGGQR